MSLNFKQIPRAAYLRYALLNAPGLLGFTLILALIDHWFDLPGWLFGVLIACWLAKDVILFPFVWKAYDVTRQSGHGKIVGERGVVTKRLAPSGYVQVRGELWRAQPSDIGKPIEKGRRVRVQKMEGLTLFVAVEETEKK